MAFKIRYDPNTGKSIAQTSGNASVKSSSSSGSGAGGASSTVYNPATGAGTRFITGYLDDGTPIYGYAVAGSSVAYGGVGSGGRQQVTGTSGGYIPGISQEGTITTAEGEKVAVKASEMRQEARDERERLLRNTYKLTENQRAELQANQDRDYLQSKPREVYVSGEDVNRVNQQFGQAGVNNAGDLFRLLREGKATATEQGITINPEAESNNRGPTVLGIAENPYYEPNVIGGIDKFSTLLNRKAQEMDLEAKQSSGAWKSAVLYQKSGARATFGGYLEGGTGIIKAVRSGDPATIFFLTTTVAENLVPGVKGFKIIKGVLAGAQTGAGIWYGNEAINYVLEADTNVEAKRRTGQMIGSFGAFYAIGKASASVASEAPILTSQNLANIKGAIQWDSVMADAQSRVGEPWTPPIITDTMRFKISDGADIIVPGGEIRGGFAVEKVPGLKGELQSQIVTKPYQPPLAVDWLTANPKAPAPSEIFGSERLNYLNNYQLQDFGMKVSTELRRATPLSETKTEPYQQSLRDYELKLNEAGKFVGPGIKAGGVKTQPVLITETPPFPKSEIKTFRGVYGKKASATIIETGGESSFKKIGGFLDEIKVEYKNPIIERPKPGVSMGSESRGFTGAIRIFSPKEEETPNIFIRSKPGTSGRYIPTSIGKSSIIPSTEIEQIPFIKIKPSTGTSQEISQPQIIEPIIIQEQIRRTATVFTPFKPTRTRPPEGENPPRPPPIKIFGGGKPESSSMFEPGFNVFVRQKGVFKQINFEPLSKGGALGLGAGVVGGSALASFKIAPSGTSAKKKGGSIFGADLSQFYTRGNVFIEKNAFRINTPGELREITYKGIASNKNKRSFFV
jgi:hypothetical protein